MGHTAIEDRIIDAVNVQETTVICIRSLAMQYDLI